MQKKKVVCRTLPSDISADTVQKFAVDTGQLKKKKKNVQRQRSSSLYIMLASKSKIFFIFKPLRNPQNVAISHINFMKDCL